MATVTRYPSANNGGWDADEANAYSDNGSYASTAPGVNSTESVEYGNFGFDGEIPAGATINSVVINAQWYVSTTASAATFRLAGLINNTVEGSEHTDTSEPTSDKTTNFSMTSLPTRDELLDGVFEVRVGAQRGAGATGYTMYLDYVSVTVDYTAGTTYNQSASGEITPSGVVANAARKVLSGALTSAGALVNAARKVLSGAITPAGALVNSVRKILAGALTSAGELLAEKVTGTTYNQDVSGTLTSAGTLIKSTWKSLSGAITQAGVLINSTRKILAGSLTSAGAVVNSSRKALAGALTSSGALINSARKVLAGYIAPAGIVIKSISVSLSGALTFAANIAKQTSKIISGGISFIGELATRAFGFIAHGARLERTPIVRPELFASKREELEPTTRPETKASKRGEITPRTRPEIKAGQG